MKSNQAMKELLDRRLHKGLHDKETHALQSLIEGEQAAVNTYNLAIRRVKDDDLIPILENCRKSHANRIGILRDRIEEIGEQAPKSAGWLGAVTALAEGGASILGDRIAIELLTIGEEFGMEQFEDHMKDLDDETFELMEENLIPAQRRTLETMVILSALMKSTEQAEVQANDEAPSLVHNDKQIDNQIDNQIDDQIDDQIDRELGRPLARQQDIDYRTLSAINPIFADRSFCKRRQQARLRQQIHNPLWFG